MSAPDGRPQPSRDASRSRSISASSLPRAGSQPRRPSQSAWSNVMDVQEAHRVLECSQTDRQCQFQQLVRHYLTQILHGCQDPHCTTPTCLTCNVRNATKPYRPPTQLTARALAHHLASHDTPHQGLCPHELKVQPSAVELGSDTLPLIQQARHGDNREYLLYPTIQALARQYSHGKGRDDESTIASPDHPTFHPKGSMLDAVKQQQQAKKDVKSLGQNLYDSVALIYSYSKQIPDSSAVFDLLRSSKPRSIDTAVLPSHWAAHPQFREKVRDEVSNVDSLPMATGPHVTSETTGPAQVVRRHSQHNLRACSSVQPRSSSPEVLGSGQQILKIPYQPPDRSSRGNKAPRLYDSTALDDVAEPPRLSITKTGRKSFTIGAAAVPTTRAVKPSMTALDRERTISKSACRNGPILPVCPDLNCDALDMLKEEVRHGSSDHTDEMSFGIDFDRNCRFRPATTFVNRSLFYTLSDPETLLRSFHDVDEQFKDSPLPHLNSARLAQSFRDWSKRNGPLIFDSLCVSVDSLLTLPLELDNQKSPHLRPSREFPKSNTTARQSDVGGEEAGMCRYLSTHEAAHIVVLCIHALTSLVPVGWAHTWAQLRKLRSWGIIVPNVAPKTDTFAHPFMEIVDEFEYEPALRLVDRLLCAIGTRICFEHILASLQQNKESSNATTLSSEPALVDVVLEHLIITERVALASKHRMNSDHGTDEDPGWTVTATFLEWLRTVIIKKWESRAEIDKWSSVGTAVILLDKLHASLESVNLRHGMFEMPFFNERLDVVEDPLKFLDWKDQPNTLHILQYPNLFSSQHLVAYFRTINFASMMTQYDHTTRVHQMQRSLDMFLREPYWWVIKQQMKITLSDYLVLDVSRESPLEDTMNQLWHQESRLLLKPLKIKMGQHEGEVGLDHGGVTYEFFRVVLSEAFRPDYGMFTSDAQTHMTWFQPAALEPLWKFEMIGILFSLAVYNGVTLPVTFPRALYHHLLAHDDERRPCDISELLEFIKDGWPGLAKAFGNLLSWNDGDVGDTIMREYSFSYEAFGHKIDHNMEHPFDPTPHPPTEAKLVTNQNREQFVRDYVYFLTDSSVRPQLRAFKKGFLRCLHPRSLLFFTPSSLRALIEGTQHISIPDLRQCTKYEQGYTATNPTITDFWAVVEQFSQDDCRHLLEFVTASDRIPVTGYESITFQIVRIGGVENLPTSSTCFGKLYLPEYGDRMVLKTKLEVAVRNSKGFGVV